LVLDTNLTKNFYEKFFQEILNYIFFVFSNLVKRDKIFSKIFENFLQKNLVV